MKQRAFTIVELLIVIVVIAILAAITIVAYNGIQARAHNTQTVSAVESWVRALRLYQADNNAFPTMVSCLGEGYGKGFSGTDSTGGQCRQDSSADSGVQINSAFTSVMAPYITSKPTPYFSLAGSASFPWYRGAYFYPAYSTYAARIDYVLEGSSTACPTLGGGQAVTIATYSGTNSVFCRVSFND